MKRVLKALGIALLGLVLLAGAVLIWGPVETVDLSPRFDPASIGPDIDAWLARKEAAFPDLLPGVEKRVVWAGQKGVKTPLAVVYLHGFSATSEEIRPVPDLVAKALGANLYFSRLTGHGLTGSPSGAPLGAASPEDWVDDAAEALAIGRRIGDRVLVIATSTGGTLAAIVAADPTLSKDVAGVVVLSPNFRLRPWKTWLLDLGLAPVWLPLLVGNQVSFAPVTPADSVYWSTTYPLDALFHAATLVRAANGLDLSTAKMPLLVFYDPEDKTVDETRTVEKLQGWGGPLWWEVRHMTPEDDPTAHVIAGAIRSPAQTEPIVDLILQWAEEKGL